MPAGKYRCHVARHAQRGFGILWVLAAVALAGLGLAKIGTVWSTEAQRERERELVRVGVQYANAISSYYYASPVARREYPRSLEALVEDTRSATVRRHLRRLYEDPVGAGRPWALIQRSDGSIVGVYSQSAGRPLRREAFETGGLQLPSAARYQDWKFIAGVGP